MGEGDEAHRHPLGSPQLCPSTGPTSGDDAQHAGRCLGRELRKGKTEARDVSNPATLPCLFSPQLEVDLLKAENDRLKVAPGPSSGSTPGQVPGSSALSSPRRSLGLALTHSFSPSLTDTGTCLGGELLRVERRKGVRCDTIPLVLVASFLGHGGNDA